MGHAPLQLSVGFSWQHADLVPQPPLAVGGQVPKAGLPLAVSAQLVAGFAEAAVEAQVVSDGVLPAVRSRLKEREVLSGKEHKGAQTSCSNPASLDTVCSAKVQVLFTFFASRS